MKSLITPWAVLLLLISATGMTAQSTAITQTKTIIKADKELPEEPPGPVVSQREYRLSEARIYTNPQKREYYIHAPHLNGQYPLEVYNLTGLKILQTTVEFHDGVYQLQLQDLKPGYYILRVADLSRKILVQ